MLTNPKHLKANFWRFLLCPVELKQALKAEQPEVFLNNNEGDWCLGQELKGGA